MSITNEATGDVLKAFVQFKDRRETIETAYPHNQTASMVGLAAANGQIIQCPRDELIYATPAENGAWAFATLTTTLRVVLDLEARPMTDDERARVGRWLITRLVRENGCYWDNIEECWRDEEGGRIEGNPPRETVRTIRDLSVGELIDLIADAKAPCIVV